MSRVSCETPGVIIIQIKKSSLSPLCRTNDATGEKVWNPRNTSKVWGWNLRSCYIWRQSFYITVWFSITKFNERYGLLPSFIFNKLLIEDKYNNMGHLGLQVKTCVGNETIMTELTDICKDKLGKQLTQWPRNNKLFSKKNKYFANE